MGENQRKERSLKSVSEYVAKNKVEVFGQIADLVWLSSVMRRVGVEVEAEALSSMTPDQIGNLLCDIDRESLIKLAAASIHFGQMATVRALKNFADAAGEKARVMTDMATRGGQAKAAIPRVNPEKSKAIEYKERHPEASSVQVKTRLRLRASPRTIRSWLSASC